MPDLLCRFCATGRCVHFNVDVYHWTGETHMVPAVIVDGGYSMCADCAKLPGAAKPSDEDKIRDAMTEASDHPGRTVTADYGHSSDCPACI